MHTIIFDFDGVFTDNKVWVSQNGEEFVKCDRSDGLGFDLLRSFIKENNLSIDYFILSTEKNNVVYKRANKLNVKCYYGVSDKFDFICKYLNDKFPDNAHAGKGVIYLGNDLNDLSAMNFAELSIAPCDAHPVIKDVADVVIQKKGGEGFVREFIEEFLDVKNLSLTELEKLV